MIADHRLVVAQSSLGEVGLSPMAAKPGGPHTVNIIVTASTYASPAVQDYRSAIADRSLISDLGSVSTGLRDRRCHRMRCEAVSLLRG